MKPQSDLD